MNKDIVSVSEAKLLGIATKLVALDTLITESKVHFELDNQNLEGLCKNQVKQLYVYNVALQEVKTIQDLLDIQRDAVRSFHWKKYNEKHQRALSAKDIEAYITGESDWIELAELYLEVVEVRRKMEAIVEALGQMGWSLTNIVKLRVQQLEHAVI